MAIPITIQIVSAPNSGSTLLSLLLGAHPDAVFVGELYQFGDYISQHKLCSCGDPLNECAFWRKVCIHACAQQAASGQDFQPPATALYTVGGLNTLEKWSISALSLLGWPRLVRGLLPLVAPTGYRRVHNIQHLLSSVRAVSGNPIIVDHSKLPLRANLLALTDPVRTKIVYLTRDGRGVINSYMGHKKCTAEKATRIWVRSNRLAYLSLKTMPAHYYLHVRYEDLCRDPEKTLRKICNFISIPFMPELFAYRRKTHHMIAGNPMRSRKDDKITEDKRWEQALSAEDLTTFERIAGKLNRKLLGEHY